MLAYVTFTEEVGMGGSDELHDHGHHPVRYLVKYLVNNARYGRGALYNCNEAFSTPHFDKKSGVF